MKDIAVFLDRDGVIVEDGGYVSKWNKRLLIPGSVEAIKILNDNDYKVVVVTNQSGIAHGYYTEKDVRLFHQLMKKELELYDATINGIYFCSHHPNGNIKKYKINCDCRKPNTGMLKRAEKELNIELSQSWMIGDKKSDIDAGKAVGCRTELVLTGQGTEELENYNIECDNVANNLFDAVDYLRKSIC